MVLLKFTNQLPDGGLVARINCVTVVSTYAQTMRKLSGSGGELAFIAALRARSASTKSVALRLGIGDDCAVLRPPAGQDVLVTTDLCLEDRHFRRGVHPPQAVGHRCLARGLSDLAAMGGVPLAAFLSLALPSGFLRTAGGRKWVDGFLAGLLALADSAGTPLAGGDTSASPDGKILADIILVGSAPRNRELRRTAARPGDLLYVTGALGGSAAELAALLATPAAFRTASADGEHPHLFPLPRLFVGQQLLRRRLAHAAVDLSDGLSTDLQHLCHESGAGAVIDTAALPLHAATQTLGAPAALKAALHGGEEYELLFTAGPATRVPASIGGVTITPIGRIVPGAAKVWLDDPNGRRKLLRAAGWEHQL